MKANTAASLFALGATALGTGMRGGIARSNRGIAALVAVLAGATIVE